MLLRISQAAKELGISVEHARRKIKSGEWPVYSLGPRTTRLDPEEIRALGRMIANAQQREKGGK